MSADAVREVFKRVDPALWIVTAADGERRGGLVATFVAEASIVPDMPRVLVGLAKHHHTWELVEASGAFVLHLVDESRIDWIWNFGLQSGRSVDKLAGYRIDRSIAGAPLLADTLAYVACRVETRLDTGDRTVYLAEITEAATLNPGNPLTRDRMLSLAPADKLQVLREQMQKDAAIDRAAIERWRKHG